MKRPQLHWRCVGGVLYFVQNERREADGFCRHLVVDLGAGEQEPNVRLMVRVREEAPRDQVAVDEQAELGRQCENAACFRDWGTASCGSRNKSCHSASI